MIKIACIGLMAVFLALKLKSVQPEYALLTGIAACIVLFGFSVSKLEVIFSGIDKIPGVSVGEQRLYRNYFKSDRDCLCQ